MSASSSAPSSLHRRRAESKASQIEPNEKKSSRPEGKTADGERFIVPETPNTAQALSNPKYWSLSSIFTLGLSALMLTSAVFRIFPWWVHFVVFLFWRLCYNVLLGVLLRRQSKYNSIINWYKRMTVNPKSCSARIVRHLCQAGLKDKTLNVDDFPDAFKAWLLFRHLVDFILCNDGSNYLYLGLVCFHVPEAWTALVAVQYVVGVFLGVFNYWAKIDAHRCIGDYSWYWGDFFFRKEENLTFDGIFELFPHPMYTVGYSLYYGYSLICRSYTVLFASLAAHFMQLLFLVLVEEPHIEKTYGSAKPQLKPEELQMLYDPKSGLFPGKQHSVFMVHFDALRYGDFSLIAFLLYAVVVTALLNQTGCVVHVIIWRIVHFVGLGTILWHQSQRQYFTRYFTDRGRTLYEAFDHWKRLYTTSSIINVVVFVGCTLRFIPFTSVTQLAQGYNAASIALGLVLIALTVWSALSTFEIIGDFGWFYGDFFIPSQAYKGGLVYTGIYRFLNNPELVTGYAGFYGLALMTQSWTIFSLALVSHLMNVVFLNVVELPHMEKLYQKSMRKKIPLERAISEKILDKIIPDEFKQKEEKMKEQARAIKLQAMKEVYSIYKSLSDLRKKKPGEQQQQQQQAVTLQATETIEVGQPLAVRFQTDANHADTDWIGIYEVDNPSVPGHSNGRWMYVVPGAEGEVVFSPAILPKSTGVYELRYHRKNTYNVLASRPIEVVASRSGFPFDGVYDVNSPYPSSPYPEQEK